VFYNGRAKSANAEKAADGFRRPGTKSGILRQTEYTKNKRGYI
jgi:hypothetical protein